MNTSIKIKELNDELKSIKTSYAQSAHNLFLYTYDLNIQSEYFIQRTVTLSTEDGSNTLASVEGATYTRLPYEGGIKLFLYIKIGDRVLLHSMQKGTITIT